MVESKVRSTLNQKKGLLVGCGCADHPIYNGCFLELSVFDVGDEWIICFSEGKKTNRTLGKFYNGITIAPYAQYGIEKKEGLENLKDFLAREVDVDLKWYNGLRKGEENVITT